MVSTIRLGNAEAKRDFIDERRVGQRDAIATEIVAGVEHELVDARTHAALAAEIGAPVAVRHGRADEPALAADDEKVDLDIRAARAARRIENMSGHAGHEPCPGMRIGGSPSPDAPRFPAETLLPDSRCIQLGQLCCADEQGFRTARSTPRRTLAKQSMCHVSCEYQIAKPACVAR